MCAENLGQPQKSWFTDCAWLEQVGKVAAGSLTSLGQHSWEGGRAVDSLTWGQL